MLGTVRTTRIRYRQNDASHLDAVSWTEETGYVSERSPSGVFRVIVSAGNTSIDIYGIAMNMNLMSEVPVSMLKKFLNMKK